MCIWELYHYLFVLENEVQSNYVPIVVDAHSGGIYRDQPVILPSLLSRMSEEQDEVFLVG